MTWPGKGGFNPQITRSEVEALPQGHWSGEQTKQEELLPAHLAKEPLPAEKHLAEEPYQPRKTIIWTHMKREWARVLARPGDSLRD